MHSLLYFPSRMIAATPAAAGLAFDDVLFEAGDGVRLHGWWVPAQGTAIGQLLYCHGNGGNLGDRVAHIAQLVAAGLDVLAFDYRGYGRSDGRPSEPGTYRDARAAHDVLLRQPASTAARTIYLGESLGGAVALKLASERPPAGLILQSAFTSIRDVARLHYPWIPRALVPDAYPSLRLIADLQIPLLVIHGDRDQVVPPFHAEELFAVATGPKRLEIFPGVGHDDFIARAQGKWTGAIAACAREWLTPAAG